MLVLEKNLGYLFKHDGYEKISSFLVVINENGVIRKITSSGFCENVTGVPYLKIAGTKKRIEFATNQKVPVGESAPKLQGTFSVVFNREGAPGLNVIQGRLNAETGLYESVQTFIDLFDAKSMFGLAESILKLSSISEGIRLPELELIKK